MSRLMMFGAAALAALVSPIATAYAQDDREIVVSAPRSEIVRQSGSMMELSVLTDSTLVSYRDIDLTTQGGRDLLQRRVNRAARQTCNRLDELNKWNIPLSGQDTCMIFSIAFAKPQIKRAVELYGNG